MKKQTKEYLANGFGSLISNQRAIDASKSFPWWVAIILLIIATFLPVIPIMTSISNSSGSSFVSTYTYSLDRDLAGISLDFREKGYEFLVGENTISFSKGTTPSETEPIGAYLIGDAGKEQYSTVFYYNDYTVDQAQTFFNSISGRKYKQQTTTIGSDTDDLYIPNIVYFFKEGLAVLLTKANSTTTATSFSGDWYQVPTGENVIETVLKTDTPTPASKTEMTQRFINESFTNWKTLFDQSYLRAKSNSLITSTFIYWGVYAALSIFLGLLIFLLTRGKTNFNRYLKWWQCMLISFWSALAPGILSMILGFILTQYAIMFFIVFMGVRIMWLSMKQLSPTYKA